MPTNWEEAVPKLNYARCPKTMTHFRVKVFYLILPLSVLVTSHHDKIIRYLLLLLHCLHKPLFTEVA